MNSICVSPRPWWHGLLKAGIGGLVLAGCEADERKPAVPVPDSGVEEVVPDSETPRPASPASDDTPLPTSSDSATPPVKEPAGVRFIGRFDWRDPDRPLMAWPGTRIIANFEGEGVTAQFEEIFASWQEGAPSEVDVAIDGVWREKVQLEAGVHSYTLTTDLGPGTHQVEIYRRTETQNGVTRFLGFEFTGGRLLPPPPVATRRIEVIGDSQSTGFGVEGVGLGLNCPGPDWAARYQNFRRAWGARLGVLLDADIYGTAYSGKGIVRNIWRADTLTMPRIYPRANPLDPDSPFDLSSATPHVIALMMGGIDFNPGQPVPGPPLTLEEFERGLDDFIGMLRSSYAETHIIQVLSPSTPDVDDIPARTYVRTAMLQVRDRRQAAGDPHIHFIEPTLADASELTGCNGHGTPEFHDRLASEIADFVRGVTGWADRAP